MNITLKSFAPQANKTGKITASAEKRALLLNELESTQGVLSMALHGKGAMQRQAAAAFQAPSLDSLLSSPVKLNGDQVATLRALLINAFGEGAYSRTTMRGLDGLSLYMQAIIKGLEARYLAAETTTQADRAKARIDMAANVFERIGNLIALRDADIAAQKVQEAMSDSDSIAQGLAEIEAKLLEEAMAKLDKQAATAKGKAKKKTEAVAA